MLLNVDLLLIILPALATGLIISITHAPLGREVLRKGIIFIDLAIAQVAGLAIIATDLLIPHATWLTTQTIALCAALSAAAFFHSMEKKNAKEQEAVIGSTYILAASTILILLAKDPRGGEDIQHILSGQILLVTWKTILTLTPLYLFAGITWFLIPRARNGFAFYAIFALVITASVQLVGVYVVFASLVFPALAVSQRPNHQTLTGLFCSLTSVIIGLIGSLALDLPAGPMLVASYAVMSILFRFFISQKIKHNP